MERGTERFHLSLSLRGLVSDHQGICLLLTERSQADQQHMA